MDKYLVYHNIKTLCSIIEQYPNASETAQQLDSLAAQLSTRTYRVAVIGEFKRGKSSLVNCILGTEILPTDILPTTAVVNRIKYGTQPKIEICYKNGNVEVATVDDLVQYATKSGNANSCAIKEIVVNYPSVFCQNSIELIDTPGLNDDEFMDKTTLDILDNIDTAIVTTHASYPMSETEKQLVCNLIEQKDIYHLTFVATFIDKVSDDEDDQDRIVRLIQERLSNDTYQMFCNKHENEPDLIKKAKRILSNPLVFAVSSRQAMRGFVTGNKAMLDKSRFPHFKYELLALLTANQETDLLMKAKRINHEIIDNFASWHQGTLEKLDRDLDSAKENLKVAQAHHSNGCEALVDALLQVDENLANKGILFYSDDEYARSVYSLQAPRITLRNLLQISLEEICLEPSIAISKVDRALMQSSKEFAEVIDGEELKRTVWDSMDEVNKILIAYENSCGLTDTMLEIKLNEWRSNTPFPCMSTQIQNLGNMLTGDEVIPHLKNDNIKDLAEWVQNQVLRKVTELVRKYQTALEDYISFWRSMLLKQNASDKAKMLELAEIYAQEIREIIQKKEALSVNYELNFQKITTAYTELEKI